MVLMVLSKCRMEQQNGQRKHGQPMEQTRSLFCMCDSLSMTTPVSLLANEFDVRSILHVQVNFAAVKSNLCHS